MKLINNTDDSTTKRNALLLLHKANSKLAIDYILSLKDSINDLSETLQLIII